MGKSLKNRTSKEHASVLYKYYLEGEWTELCEYLDRLQIEQEKEDREISIMADVLGSFWDLNVHSDRITVDNPDEDYICSTDDVVVYSRRDEHDFSKVRYFYMDTTDYLDMFNSD